MGFCEVACVLAAIIGGVGGQGTTSEPITTGVDSGWTLGRVRREANATRERIRSILIESNTIGSVFGQRRQTHEIVAVHGMNRFVERKHLGDGNALEIATDPEWRRSYLSENMLMTVWMIDRFCKISREQATSRVGDTVRYQFFMECIGWWPPGECELSAVRDSAAVSVPTEKPWWPPVEKPWWPPAESGRSDARPDWALCKVLGNEECRLQSQFLFLAGQRCVVIELPGREKIWLDVDHGCAIVRREREDNAVRTLYWNSDFRQVVPGIWLPWRLHRTICRRAHNATREHERENVVIEAAQTIVRMQVNSIPQDMFVLKPQPGMLMFDAERNATWQIPGGEHQVLDQVVRAALASVRVEAVTNREPIRDYLVAVGLVLLFAGALPLVPRLRRRRNHRPWLAG